MDSEMNFIQQEINSHKTKLINLVNRLVSTQIINEEILINIEIKTESECLNSLLNIKQNKLSNNNMNNLNPLNFYPNLTGLAPFQFQQQNLQNNIQNSNEEIISIEFKHNNGKKCIINTNSNEKVSYTIYKYRNKANDYMENSFIFNGRFLDPFSKSTLAELGIKQGNVIYVSDLNNLNGYS